MRRGSVPALLSLLVGSAVPSVEGGGRVVSRPELVAAMKTSRGFDPTKTTNGARLQAEAILRLLETEQAKGDGDVRLFVGHEDWFAAYLEHTGLSPSAAPLFIRLAREHGQDLEIDGRAEQVIERVLTGPPPRRAANVVIGWPDGAGARDRYSYDDTLAVPDLRVTNGRVIVYRLIDYGDVVAYEDVEGLRGRPTEGFLGFLFDLIGEGSVQWSRMAISTDGLQVSRARATKGPFGVESTVTIHPDGRMEKDVPPGRDDLRRLEQRLLEPRSIRYRPLSRSRAPADPDR